ncbi:hypothetical protein PRIPAC_79415 [Pristionchus pacificus]|uniref:Nuclear receptor n=1 Tax=Pristionchus pacificus TaxID=54126 RepID=A0A2A6CKC2_PRIPA|nr:hypothetical protein PRIPAC_79415 [Pristionchus pacificus]|eukprot:PDM78481.1 nuclear receptor [Pristionchus pacificus]
MRNLFGDNNAQACNNCANFFRRNVLKKRDGLLCNSRGLLESQKCFNDRKCVTCRLDLLCSVTKHRQKGVKVEIVNEDKQMIMRNPAVPEQVIDRVILNLNLIEDAFDRLRKSKFNPLPGSVRSLKEALSGSCKLSIDYGVEKWSLSYPAGYKNDEGTLLDNVFRRIRFGLERENYKDNRKSWNFANVIFAIEYFKAFPFFTQLSTQTRRVLAGKMAFLCTNLTNLFYSIQQEKLHLVFPDGLALCAGMERSFEQVTKSEENWIQSVKIMNLDKNECALLKILLILSPSLDDALSNERALLTSYSESYAKILFSYVMTRRGSERGPRSFQEMLSLIETINHRVKREKDVLVFALGMFTNLCPLLAEIITI